MGPEEMLWSIQHEENWMLSPKVEQDISGEKILDAATAYDKTVKRDEMIVKVKHKIVASMDHYYAREYPTKRYKIERTIQKLRTQLKGRN